MSNKVELRQKFLAIRNALTDEYENESQVTIERKVKWFINHYNLKEVGFYASTGSEVFTNSLIQYCLENDVDVYLPKMGDGNEMEFYLIRDLDKDLTTNKNYNILEPIAEKTLILEDANKLDALFVPLICFDKKLNRIGYGKGYYDRWIKEKNYNGYKIGLSRITQLSDTIIDNEKEDATLDFVITDKEVFVPFGEDDDKEFDYDVTYWKLGEDHDDYN